MRRWQIEPPPEKRVVIDLRGGGAPPWVSAPSHQAGRPEESPPSPSGEGSDPKEHHPAPARKPISARKAPKLRLSRAEPLHAGVRRLCLDQFDFAIGHLAENSDHDMAVHEARKALRRVRALLRLVRDEIGEESFGPENVVLRDTGRLLTEARSGAVLATVLQGIGERYRGLLVPDAFAAIAAELEERKAAALHRLYGDSGTRSEIGTTLRSVRGRYAAGAEGELGRQVSLVRNRFDAIAPGLARTYGRGRRAMAEAYRDPTPENFHEWRKRVRYLRFQLEALQGMWPEVVGGAAVAAASLADALGEEHDLAELGHLVGSKSSPAPTKRYQELLLAITERRRSALQGRARRLGRRLYAEPPDRFVARLGAYWAAWRS